MHFQFSSDQSKFKRKQNVDSYRFLFQSKAILSKSQVRIVDRRNARGIQEMLNQINQLELYICRNERLRRDEKRHISRILFEMEMQKRGKHESRLKIQKRYN